MVLQDNAELLKNVADGTATAGVVATVLGMLPDIAMLLTIAWFAVRLYGGIVKERHMRRIRAYEIARLEREASAGATVAPGKDGE